MRRRWLPQLLFLAWIACLLGGAIGSSLVWAGEPVHETLHLNTGGQLAGHSVSVEDGHLRWEMGHDQQLLIPVEWIERLEVGVIGPPPAPPNAPSTPTPTPQEPDPRWTDAIPWVSTVEDWSEETWAAFQKWTRRIQVGGQFLDGNTQTDLLDVIFDFERGTTTQVRQVDLGGQWAHNQGKETINRWFANTNFDWPISEGSRWITFVTSKNEYNALQNLDYRGTVSIGSGYRFFNEPKKRLITRFGPAFTVEVFHDPVRQRQTPDIFGEIELRWPLRERLQFEEKFRVQPSMLDMELVRVFSTTGLVWDLDEKDRWKLRLGMQFNYNSQPNEGRVPSDYISTLSLVYLRK
jgi:putative salt-induced outer membrane protein YdiY